MGDINDDVMNEPALLMTLSRRKTENLCVRLSNRNFTVQQIHRYLESNFIIADKLIRDKNILQMLKRKNIYPVPSDVVSGLRKYNLARERLERHSNDRHEELRIQFMKVRMIALVEMKKRLHLLPLDWDPFNLNYTHNHWFNEDP